VLQSMIVVMYSK